MGSYVMTTIYIVGTVMFRQTQKIVVMKSQLVIYIFSLTHLLCRGDEESLTSVVQTDKGPVQGEIRKTVWNSVPFSSFRGIRYGKPPVGTARFRAPEEAEPWSDTFQATSEANPCPQINMNTELGRSYMGDEDCLNLNVYTPLTDLSNETADGKLKPVMVWMYGGSFITGFNNITLYGPDFLIEEDVVVVVMNYRIGLLGFLALGLPGAPGNAGLKDQLLALKWVQRNIKNFGGDPDSVTIFGESAGAASVDYHVVSDQSKGLFHRAISMSGAPFAIWAFSTRIEAITNGFKVGNNLGIYTLSTKRLLEDLYEKSAEEIVVATAKLGVVYPTFKPIVENPKVSGEDIFLTECALKKYKTGNYSDVPYLQGFMSNETLTFIAAPNGASELLQYTRDLVDGVDSPSLANKVPYLKKLIKSAAKGVGFATEKFMDAVIRVTTDILYIAPIDQKQKLMTKYGTQPVYYYRNSFTSDESVHALLAAVNLTGAGHADDVAHCWYISFANFSTNPESPLVMQQKRVTRMWTNFAKFSDPTPDGTNDQLLNIVWPVSGPDGKRLDIDRVLSVGPGDISKFASDYQRSSEPLIAGLSGCGLIKV